MTAYTSTNDAELYKGEKYQELTLGQPFLGTIEVAKDSFRSYFFSLDIPESLDKDAAIIVRLTGIKGSFTYCVSANNSQIEDASDCTWDDYNFDGVITFTSKDPKFKPKGTYGILVKPYANHASNGQKFSFSLRVISPFEYSGVLIGSPEYFSNVPVTELYFQTGIEKKARFFTVLMTTDDPDCQLLVTNDVQDFNNETKPSTFLKKATGKRPFIYYNTRDLEKLCEPYERDYRSKADMVDSVDVVQPVYQAGAFQNQLVLLQLHRDEQRSPRIR